MTSVESAAISGFAHNTIFLGTDNFNSLKFCRDYYNEKISAFSVFATEHSTTTANTAIEGEEEFVYRMLQENPDAPIMSFVADSYDVYKFTDMVTHPSGKIRKLLEERDNQQLVIRPDSGDPIEVLGKILKIMYVNNAFNGHRNGKLISTKYSILWGDGINKDTIKNILETFTVQGYELLPLFAAENFVFGSGTQLGQTGLTRDTYSFACKCSYIEVMEDGELKGYDVFKDPITDSRKKSLKGYLEVYKDKEGNLICLQNPIKGIDDKDLKPAMKVVYSNGEIKKEYSLKKIRNRIKEGS
jgi:nicotinamide phosphoribosyltransferase